jgi:hypothetical protein
VSEPFFDSGVKDYKPASASASTAGRIEIWAIYTIICYIFNDQALESILVQGKELDYRTRDPPVNLPHLFDMRFETILSICLFILLLHLAYENVYHKTQSDVNNTSSKMKSRIYCKKKKKKKKKKRALLYFLYYFCEHG